MCSGSPFSAIRCVCDCTIQARQASKFDVNGMAERYMRAYKELIG
jgi:hypothetical protein